MQFEVVSSKILEDSVDPRIQIKCKISYVWSNNLITNISARLYSSTGKIIAALVPQLIKNTSRRITADHTNDNRETIEFFLHGTVSEKAADCIEKSRENDKKENVQIEVKGECEYIDLSVYKQAVNLLSDESGEREFLCVAGNYSQINLLAYRDYIGEVRVLEISKGIEIAASDWMHDYKPLLGLGSFIGIELPLPSSNSNSGVEAFKQVFGKIDKIKEHYLNCRWGDVVSDFRKTMEFLRTDDAKKALEISKRYNPATRKDLGSLINSGFDFASKFQHVTDRNRIVTDNPEQPTRAEGEFCLGFVTGLSAL